jgi:hypothetical protein
LFKKGINLIVCTEEIAQEYTLKEFPQYLFEDWRGPGRGDEVISHPYLLASETPKPVGFAPYPPSGLVYLEQGAGFSQHAQVLIPGEKDSGKPLPSQGKATSRYLKI